MEKYLLEKILILNKPYIFIRDTWSKKVYLARHSW